MATQPSGRQHHGVAGSLTRSAPTTAGWRALAGLTLAVVLLHALVLAAFSLLLRPPSLLKDVVAPVYTRTITPEAPPAVVAAATPAAPVSKPNRPSARIQTARAAPKKRVIRSSGEAPPAAPHAAAPAPEPEPGAGSASPDVTPAADPPEWPASAVAQADLPPGPAAAAPAVPAASATPTASAPDGGIAATTPSPPAPPASAAAPAFLAEWPRDTRMSYKLGGNYRGELHGDARVLWQREGTRYQASVQLDVGLLLSMSLTSQGDITAGGLKPEVYEELVRNRRRGVRLGEDVRLNNGNRVPRPQNVQDAASQFVELSHRLATGQVKAEPGARIDFWLARPGGVDEWTYDVVGEETLQLPRLGAVRTLHLKPRPLAKPRGPIMAEMWFAPSLQYLPVRIRITREADTYVDLTVDQIEQR